LARILGQIRAQRMGAVANGDPGVVGSALIHSIITGFLYVLFCNNFSFPQGALSHSTAKRGRLLECQRFTRPGRSLLSASIEATFRIKKFQ
jgi:hypothetical protein